MQRHRLGPLKEALKVRLIAVLGADCVWEKTQDEERDA
jgi:hypothetical protein